MPLLMYIQPIRVRAMHTIFRPRPFLPLKKCISIIDFLKEKGQVPLKILDENYQRVIIPLWRQCLFTMSSRMLPPWSMQEMGGLFQCLTPMYPNADTKKKTWILVIHFNGVEVDGLKCKRLLTTFPITDTSILKIVNINNNFGQFKLFDWIKCFLKLITFWGGTVKNIRHSKK